MKRIRFLLMIVPLLLAVLENGQSADTTTYDFRDGTIITNGQSDNDSLILSGTYSYHSATYGLNMKLGAQIKIVVSGSCTIQFLGSEYSSLSMSGETSDGTPLDPATQPTAVTNDLSDTYKFVYFGFADTLIFTASESGSDIYLPLIEVISFESPVAYDFRDGGTMVANGQSDDGSLKLSGTYSHHGDTYGLNMKLDAQIKIAVNGSCAVRFLGSEYSSLSMSAETSDSAPLDPASQSTTVANDLSDKYEFVYYGFADTLVFTATGSGSDIYLPLIEVIPYEAPTAYDFRDGGTMVANGQSDDGSLKLSGTYSHHGDTYGLNMKLGAQIKIAVSGSCTAKFLGSAYSSLSMSGETTDGTPLDPATQATAVASDLSDKYEFAYSGDADTLIFTATGSGSDIYLPLIEIIPGDVKTIEWEQKSGSIIFNGDTIYLTSGATSGEDATVTVNDGTVISATAEMASVRMDLGGNPLSSFSPTVTDSISSVTISGDTLLVAFADSTYYPWGYKIVVADNSTTVEAEAGKTYIYSFADGSELPQTSYQSLRYQTFVTSDGIVTLNSNTDTESEQFGYHDATHGIVMFPGNSVDMIVAGNATITFIVCTYGVATDATFEFKDGEDNSLGSIPAQNIGLGDAHASSFTYTGPAGKITADLVSPGHPGAEIYIHGMNIANEALIEPSNGKIDVWDFGAEQLDTTLYNNKLTVDSINAWYDSSIPVGSSGNVLPSFTSGVLSWIGGSNDRLRSTNTSLTRYDENISGVSGYTGRVYVNSSANTGRYMSLTLSEDDEVTIIALSQNGSGSLNFEYVPDPDYQTDLEDLGPDATEFNFVAKQAGTYHIFDDKDKPSYYRIYRKDADYVTVSGTVDTTAAPEIPAGFGINMENEAGKVWNMVVTDSTYSFTVPAGYTYALSLSDANGYVISNGNSLVVTDTTVHNVAIEKVELYTVSGSITGLDSAGLANLSLVFTADTSAHKIYIPEPVIDAGAATYSVQLEPACDYTISALGVNDYYIPDDVINIEQKDTTIEIAFVAKPVYDITFNVTGLTAEQLGDLQLTFTNLYEEGYVYSFESVTNVSLRDGTYSIAYSGLDDYPVQMRLTSNLTVSGSTTSKDLVFNPVTEWTFDDKDIVSSSYKGLLFTGNVGNEVNKGHLTAKDGATIQIPVDVGDKIRVTYYYTADFSIEGTQYTTSSGSTSILEYAEYTYTGTSAGYVTITVGSGASTTYITQIAIGGTIDYAPVIYVGTDKEYTTINEALDAIAKMIRNSDERVTVMIDPGNYEEMLVIDVPNVTFRNAAADPSIGLTNAGVDIEEGAVRITSYYGHGYNYYSMGSDQKWDADVLRVNKENGYFSYENKGAGTTNGSYWNATVVVSADGFEAEYIIFENSFNQYISQKESEDVVVMWESGSKGERPTDVGNTSVQDRSYVERACAVAITNNTDKVVLTKCRVVGRQDAIYGGVGARVVVNRGAMMGAVDYIFGGMTAVFYKTDLVMNTSDVSSDATYITAAQQSGGRGYLMYKCAVKSTVPGIETASANPSKPGYFGRPWQATTSEVVFYNTTVDASGYPGYEGESLITPVGWSSSLGGESNLMYEYGTVEKSGEDNTSSRASWSTVLSTPTLSDGTDITTFNFTKGTDNWDPLPVETDVLTVSTNSLDIAAAGGTASFDILSNVGWSVSSDQSWLTVNGIGSGIDTASITLTATENTDGSTRTATVTVYGNGVTVQTITVSQDATTGIYEISGNTLDIYPNPASSFINVDREHSGPEKLLILNNLGQVVYGKMLESENETITLPPVQSGIYIVKIGTRNVKLIINK